jgi:hypothetical protein
VSSKSGIFYASTLNMTRYFGTHRNVVSSTLAELQHAGFLELVQAERGKPNCYKLIDHKVWAAAHPGQCVQESSMPWKGEGDPLGPQLYAISGGRAKFWPRQMTGLRNLGFSDDQITDQFRAFLEKWEYRGRVWKRMYFDFLVHLKAAAAATTGDVHCRKGTASAKRVRSNGHLGARSNGHYSSKESSNPPPDSSIPAVAVATADDGSSKTKTVGVPPTTPTGTKTEPTTYSERVDGFREQALAEILRNTRSRTPHVLARSVKRVLDEVIERARGKGTTIGSVEYLLTSWKRYKEQLEAEWKEEDAKAAAENLKPPAPYLTGERLEERRRVLRKQAEEVELKYGVPA